MSDGFYWECLRCRVHLWDGKTVKQHSPECQKTYLPNGNSALIRDNETVVII